MQFVLDIGHDATFLMLLLDLDLGAVHRILNLMIIGSLALALASAPTPVNNLSLDPGTLLEPGHRIDISQILGSLDHVALLDYLALLPSIQVTRIVALSSVGVTLGGVSVDWLVLV